MRSGKLSIRDVEKTCKVSDKTAYRWKSMPEKQRRQVAKKSPPTESVFAEVKIEETAPKVQAITPSVVLKRAGTEVVLPADYPVDSMVRLIKAMG